MAENFANFDEEWIKKVGKRWEKGNMIRYYFNSVTPIFDRLGINYTTYKTGNFSSVDGYSNNDAYKLNIAFSRAYFDAVAGKFAGIDFRSSKLASSLQSELESALIRSKSERVARQAVSSSLNGKSQKRAGASGNSER